MIYKLISIILYAFSIPVFIFSATCLIIISFVHFPLFFKVDKIFCRLILLSFGVVPRVSGSFPNNGPFIIMMNHSSFLDVFLFPLIPVGIYTGITATENFKYPIFSYLIRRINAIPIDRKNSKSAIKSIERAQEVLGRGVHIGILPEGSRTTTGKMRKLKKGGFHMAMNTGVPILPVGARGAFICKPKNRWWIRPGRVVLNIGKPLLYEDYKNLDVNALLRVVEEKLQYLSGENYENK